MYAPPPGYLDCEADAAAAPDPTGPFRPIAVPGVGVFHARVPMPAAIHSLAMAVNPKTTDRERVDNLNHFIRQHLQPGEFDSLLVRMLTDDRLPEDAMLRVSRAIATAGTARPYTAVINLALLAAHNWRVLRSKLRGERVGDPMRMPSMHAVLDAAEDLAVESATAGAKTSTEARQKVSDLHDRLYAPELAAAQTVNGEDYLPIPEGFDAESMEASFDAFLKTAR